MKLLILLFIPFSLSAQLSTRFISSESGSNLSYAINKFIKGKKIISVGYAATAYKMYGPTCFEYSALIVYEDKE